MLGLSDAKGVVAPGARYESPPNAPDIKARRLEPRDVEDPEGEWPGHDNSPVLEGDRLRRYQSVYALLNYGALDRPDLLYPIKELMRWMSKATSTHESKLKRVVRFLKTLPRMTAQYPWGSMAPHITVFTDSDHAGCPITRRSTVGGCVLWGDASSRVGRKRWRFWP